MALLVEMGENCKKISFTHIMVGVGGSTKVCMYVLGERGVQKSALS